MTPTPFTPADLEQLRRRGIPVDEANRQLELFRNPPGYLHVVRPCTVGDGIERVAEDEAEALIALHEQAARQGRCAKFVPASGAATRMFKDLLAYREKGSWLSRAGVARDALSGSAEARAVLEFLDNLPRFAFDADLRRILVLRGHDPEAPHAGETLEALLSPEGLGYAELPKGLLHFHRYPEGHRTAFEEHLVESAGFVADVDGTCRVHFTVSPEHRNRFEALLEDLRPDLERRLGARFVVGFSEQKPSTDTLAVDLAGLPFRDGAGALLFRPSGHGALIENVQDLGGDIVFMKNIDNIVPEDRQGVVVRWKKILGGWLVGLQREMFLHAARMRATDPETRAIDEAAAFVERRLRLTIPHADHPPRKRVAALRDALERPLRVCGVVKNAGEPGGGPFWVRGRDGAVTRQIVEGTEFDPSSREQKAILRAASHFNPVDLVCGVRDAAGEPFDLSRFVDPLTVMISRKSHGQRELKALERPGLWNGAMARWNTVFVEVPAETFAPVKTVHDLLRAEHQPKT